LTTELWLSRLSPNTLYGEAALGLLHPDVRTLGPIFLYQLEGMVLGAPLPFGESFKLVWPQIVGLIAATILLFTATYVIFQRQEIRA
jgi:ABC-2 type transport system permease protein